jgi:SAM-dependent methyltransferase
MSRPGRRAVGRLLASDRLVRLGERYLQRAYRIRAEIPHPDLWFEHRADLHRWSELQNPMWVERGVFARSLMAPGCRVLDLTCGDGFYPFHFYASVAERVDALDRSKEALEHAARWHADPRIRYRELDVLADEWPSGPYDVICWDASIQYFSPDEARAVLEQARRALADGGVLCGSTNLGGGDEFRQQFDDAAAVEALLLTVFPFAATATTESPGRRMVYFRAAESGASLADFRTRSA